ncbi:Transposon Tf2-6 polyprotein, partial [Aduncisulcus paluster]
MLTVEVKTPKLGPLSRESWQTFRSEYKTYRNRGGQEEWTSLIEPGRLESLRALYLEDLVKLEDRLVHISDKVDAKEAEKGRIEKRIEELDQEADAEKLEQYKDRLTKTEDDLDKLLSKLKEASEKIDDDLFQKLTESFGGSTTKDVIDSIKLLKMDDCVWTLDNYTGFATGLFGRVKDAKGIIPEIKKKFISGLRPARFAERVMMLEKVDQAPNSTTGIKTLMREANVVWMEILGVFEEAKSLGMLKYELKEEEQKTFEGEKKPHTERKSEGVSKTKKHKQKDYDKQKQDRQGKPKSQPYCDFCKMKGHWTSRCRKLKAVVNSNQYLSRFKEKGMIMGKEIDILLDTGAQASCIKESTVKELKIERKPCKIVLSLADGSERIIDSKVEVVFAIKNANGKRVVIKEEKPCKIVLSLADGSERIIDSKVEVVFAIKNANGKRVVIKEECLVVKSRGKKQPGLIIKRDTCLKYNLLSNLSCDNIETEDFGIQIRNIPNEAKMKEKIAPDFRKDLFPVLADYYEGVNVNKTALVDEFKIELNDQNDLPPKQNIYPIPFARQEFARREIEDLLQRGHIEPTKAGNPAPCLVVCNNGKLRLVIDYRKLNSKIKADTFPIPLQNDLFQGIQEAGYFCQLDLKNGYHNVKIEEGSKDLTTFAVPWGVFRWNVMPFGIMTAPSHFQRIMEKTVGKCEGVAIYLDDILIKGKTKGELVDRTKKVLKILKERNLILNLEKSNFGNTRVKYLGFIFEKGKMAIAESKKTLINMFTVPKTKRQLRSFLGMLNFVREFVPNMAVVATPLYHATNGPGSLIWNEECENAFVELKKRVTNAEIRWLYDPKLSLRVYTDASKLGVGAVLKQIDGDGNERTIAYASRKFNERESNWPTIEQEAFGLYWACKTWRQFLLGREFELYTDHRNLLFIEKSPSSTILRYKMYLAEYQHKLVHVPGLDNSEADFLSRSIVSTAEAAEEASQGAKSKEPEEMPSTTELEMDKLEEKLKNIQKRLKERHAARHDGGKALIDFAKKEGWKGKKIEAEAKKIAKECIICQKLRNPEPFKEFGTLYKYNPFNTLSVDTNGPYKEDGFGYKYILVLIDNFTRYIELVPLRSLRAEETADAIIKRIFLRYGIPRVVHSDNGKQFVNALMRQIYNLFGIKQSMSTPYHHEGNGLVERANKTINAFMRIAKLELGRDISWSTVLQYVQFVMNNTKHRILGCSPHFALFGYVNEPNGRRGTLETLLKEKTASTTTAQGLKEFLRKIHQEIIFRQDIILKRRKTEEIAFKVGQRVLVVNENKKKLEASMLGPFKITKKLDKFHYEIEIAKDVKKVLHISSLREFFGNQEIDLKEKFDGKVIQIIEHRRLPEEHITNLTLSNLHQSLQRTPKMKIPKSPAPTIPNLLAKLEVIKCQSTGQSISASQILTYCYEWTKLCEEHRLIIKNSPTHHRDMVDLFVRNLGPVPFTKRVQRAVEVARSPGYRPTGDFQLQSEALDDVKAYVNLCLRGALDYKAHHDQLMGITSAAPSDGTKAKAMKSWDDVPAPLVLSGYHSGSFTATQAPQPVPQSVPPVGHQLRSYVPMYVPSSQPVSTMPYRATSGPTPRHPNEYFTAPQAQRTPKPRSPPRCPFCNYSNHAVWECTQRGAHDNVFANHVGINKMMEYIRTMKLYIPRLRERCKKHIDSCGFCQKLRA